MAEIQTKPHPAEMTLDYREILPPPEHDTLGQASRVLYEITSSVAGEYAEHGRRLNKQNDPAFWMRVAEESKAVAQEDFSTIDSLQLGRAIELTGSTPYFLVAQKKLQSGKLHKYPEHEVDNLKHFACNYNRLLSGYVEASPSTTAVELNNHLLEVARHSGISQHPERFQSIIADEVRGIQREVAGGQLLSMLGEVRKSSLEEDLQGFDYFAHIPELTPKPLLVDIKANRRKILRASRGRSDSAAFIGNKLMLYSHVSDNELQGRFYVDQDQAEKLSAEMYESIATAVNHRHARSG